MSEPPAVAPDEIYQRLVVGAWATQRTLGMVRAYVCPLCGALVAKGAPAGGLSWRELHARDHSTAVGRQPWREA